MARRHSSHLVYPRALAVLAALAFAAFARLAPSVHAADAPAPEEFAAAVEKDVTQGALRFPDKNGQLVECPLKHTDVKAEVSGFLARVNVTQTFHNPTDKMIEAVYVFPLPHEAAVDNMTLVIGDRKVVGVIKPRDEARRVYEQALAQGQTAALLEQERPNIFTQSVGNIAPGQEVKIEISYVDPLRYDMGVYEFSFPMVVGPRYHPGAPVSSPQPQPAELQGKVSPPVADTTRVPDASRISPPVLKPGYRTGHDIRLSVTLDAGVPVQNLTIPNHQAQVERDGETRATIMLSPADSVPNKDFVLRYDVVGEKPSIALLTHTGKYSADAAKLGEGYFLLMVQPKEDERLKKSPPREIVFLCDVSGSMSGQPTAKVREAMDQMLKLCREKDTVQVITFAGQANKLFEKPVPVTQENIRKAVNFTNQFEGSGGTEMLKGVQLAIDEPVDRERVRIIVMLTDGYIGNEAEIIEHVGKNCGDRVRFWTLGIGSSPNMFLVDGVAKQGGGMGKKLGLEDDTVALSQEIMARIQRAQLANVKIDWGQLQVAETYPARIPELWAGRPIIVYGRYQGGGAGTITVRGDVEGEPASWPLEVVLAKEEPKHDVLAKVWARQKIEDLMQQDFYQDSPPVEETVTALALDYQLMSQYTSFVAVDAQSETTSDAPRPPRRMLVPVPLPEGTRWEGFFGEREELEKLAEVDGLLRGGEMLRKKFLLGDVLEGKAVRRLYRTAPGDVSNFGALKRQAHQYFAPSAGWASTPLNVLARAPAMNRRASANGQFGNEYAARLGAVHRQSGMGGLGGGGFGRGLQAEYAKPGSSTTLAFRFQTKESLALDDKDGSAPVDFDFTGAALQQNASSLTEDAAKALEVGQTQHKEGELAEAQAALLKAYFLDTAAMNLGASSGQTGAAALAALEEVRKAQLAGWRKSLPQLDKRLDLVIRDKSVPEALETIARAAEIDLRVVRGSITDAADLLNTDEPRVSFLDLRGATLAQALDWALRPLRLDWTVAERAVTVRSARRGAGGSPWVYDVSLLALPALEDVNKESDYQKRMEMAKQQADAFLQAVRDEFPGDEVRLEWFAPGQLLAIATPKAHQRITEVIRLLSDAKAPGQLGPAAEKLRPTTVQRANRRKADLAHAREVARRLEVLAAHDTYAWMLLAAAAGGRLDLEAITELQIAWSQPETTKLLEAKAPGILMRSWWAIAESARALPEEAELQTLAQKAEQRAQPVAERVIKTLQENPSDAQAALISLYAALAMNDQAETRALAARAIQATQGEDASLGQVRGLAAALFASDARQIPVVELVALVSSPLEGDDLVTLAALACRRAGGEAWEAFRSRQYDLLGKQPLSGDVIVLVNRLSASYLLLASQAAR